MSELISLRVFEKDLKVLHGSGDEEVKRDVFLFRYYDRLGSKIPRVGPVEDKLRE